MTLNMINQPGGPHVLTGDTFTDDKDLVARTTPTPSAPYFVAEHLGRKTLLRHSVWTLAVGSCNGTGWSFEAVAHNDKPGNIYHLCKVLNDDYWTAQAAARSDGKE